MNHSTALDNWNSTCIPAGAQLSPKKPTRLTVSVGAATSLRHSACTRQAAVCIAFYHADNLMIYHLKPQGIGHRRARVVTSSRAAINTACSAKALQVETLFYNIGAAILVA
jgi:hypothetical protein